jgi:hypothetical protein
VTYKVKNAFFNEWVSEHLEVKRTKNLYKEDAALMIFTNESLNTLLSVIHVKKTRLTKTDNMIKWYT